jgi:hypothetical protein
MSRKSLSELKNEWPTANSTEKQSTPSNFNNYYPFWLMQPGEKATIRFVPDKNAENPDGFWVEKTIHTLQVNGQARSIPCRNAAAYGKLECPVCKASRSFYDNKDEVNGKRYWRKKQYLTQAIVLEDPLPVSPGEESHVGKLRYVTLSYQLLNIIKDSLAEALDEWPDNIDEGYDFVIKKSMQGQYASYVVGTRFASKPRALTPSERELVAVESIDLATLLPKDIGLEKVTSMLAADMSGSNYSETAEAATQSQSAPTPSTQSAPAPSTQSAPAPSAPSMEESPAVTDLIASIRNKRSQSA